MPQAQNGSTVRFGVFEANLASAELRKNGQKIKLQDQPFQVLTILLENPGEIVTREQFRDTLWPADTFVDFDHGLNAAIKRLRDALGDSADSPRFVETLARRGYRFIAPVSVSANGNGNGNGSHAAGAVAPPAIAPASLTPAAPVVTTEPRLTSGRPSAAPTRPNIFVRHWLLALSAAALLIVGTIAGFIAARRLTQKPSQLSESRLTNNSPDDPITSVALSPDSKYIAFADRTGLFLRELATGETHSIDVPGVLRPRARAWFPDGSHLLVNAGQPTGVINVYNVPLLGGSPRKLVDNADARSVSSDGSQIAVVRNDWPNQEVWIFSSDGQNPRQLVAATGDVFGSVVWSPHGRKLAFVRYKYGASHHESENSLEIYDLDTSQTHVILSNPALADSLVWSPDGRLIYSLQEQTPSPSIKSGEGDSNFWALSVDENSSQPSGTARRLTSGLERKLSPSLSADGKHLAFVRWNGEAHVYFSEVEPGARRIGAPQRLSLEEGRNYPFGWTGDGKSIIFASDRAGQTQLFKQRMDQPAPDLLVGGKDGVALARPSPDGSQVFYLAGAQGSNGGDNGQKGKRLMRVSLSGGAPQLILQRETIDNFQCASLPATLCIFGQATAQDIQFIQFDPVTGQQTPLGFGVKGSKYNWSLSPDGQTIALAQWRRPEIYFVSTKTGKSRTLTLQSERGVSSLDWAFDGQSLWASSSTFTGTQALLNIDLRGRVRQLFQDPDKDVGWAIPSADGRHIAFWEAGGSSNAWVLKDF
ncbi:MAG TPA: winged helix-turn-helix domain-containing protein [Candidatus Sulfotelmatobacter sp.]|nr:winged helix-turn-helix domain-containing protein [Candidatus Sulfotelmatobacter sp.]